MQEAQSQAFLPYVSSSLTARGLIQLGFDDREAALLAFQEALDAIWLEHLGQPVSVFAQVSF